MAAVTPGSPAVRWVIAALCALAIVALLAYARNDPGVGGRFPDPEDVPAAANE